MNVISIYIDAFEINQLTHVKIKLRYIVLQLEYVSGPIRHQRK